MIQRRLVVVEMLSFVDNTNHEGNGSSCIATDWIVGGVNVIEVRLARSRKLSGAPVFLRPGRHDQLLPCLCRVGWWSSSSSIYQTIDRLKTVAICPHLDVHFINFELGTGAGKFGCRTQAWCYPIVVRNMECVPKDLDSIRKFITIHKKLAGNTRW